MEITTTTIYKVTPCTTDEKVSIKNANALLIKLMQEMTRNNITELYFENGCGNEHCYNVDELENFSDFLDALIGEDISF